MGTNSRPTPDPTGSAGAGERASLELLYQISRELSSQLELPTLLQHILQTTTEALGAPSASILALDTDGEVMEGALIVEGRPILHTADQLAETLERGLAGWVVRQRQAALIADTRADERWLQRPGDRGPKGYPQRSRSAVSVPLLARGQVVGALTLVHPSPGRFGPPDLDLLTAIAEVAGVAVENARLFADSQRRTQAMATLAETSRVITASLDLEEVLRRILSRTRNDLGAEAASIALVERDSGVLQFRLAEGEAAEQVVGLRLRPGEGIAGWVAQHGQPVIVPDVQADPRFASGVDRRTGFATRALACVPIQGMSQTLGVLEVINPGSGGFDSETLSLLESIASLAGTAILHAQLFADTQAAERRFAGLFEDSIDPILITDLSATVTDANRRATEFLGYAREDLIGMKVEAFHRIDSGGLGEEIFQDLAAGKALTFEASVTARDGRPLPVEVHAKRIERNGQEFVQWIEHDLTERAAIEEMRNDLTAMIYHDLRAPLGNIVSSLDVLENGLPPDNPTLQTVLAIAARATQRLTRLVDSLLDIQRLESGRAILHKEPISIEALAAEAAEAALPVAEAKRQALNSAVPPGLPPVSADAELIRRVLINLMENAAKYTPPGGRIEVSAEAGSQELTVTVSDNGPGIPPEQKLAIFDKFARIQRPGGPKGMGLGLAFCRLAVQAHGGRIWVDSEPGSGSRFRFTLPL